MADGLSILDSIEKQPCGPTILHDNYCKTIKSWINLSHQLGVNWHLVYTVNRMILVPCYITRLSQHGHWRRSIGHNLRVDMTTCPLIGCRNINNDRKLDQVHVDVYRKGFLKCQPWMYIGFGKNRTRLI